MASIRLGGEPEIESAASPPAMALESEAATRSGAIDASSGTGKIAARRRRLRSRTPSGRAGDVVKDDGISFTKEQRSENHQHFFND